MIVHRMRFRFRGSSFLYRANFGMIFLTDIRFFLFLARITSLSSNSLANARSGSKNLCYVTHLKMGFGIIRGDKGDD